ncbi:MAG: phosphoglycerate kinase, partial [Cyanobacteria bacterium REEB65]|nr:phosphoglycerate kinase [Cyanobacteria bacterium REEB65]
MPAFRSLDSLGQTDLNGKRVLVREDFNVPLSPAGAITDDTRIRAALPTLRYLCERGARVVVVSHLGRPKGPDAKLSLAPVAERLGELLGTTVPLAPDSVGPVASQAVDSLAPGKVLLLENIRFHPQEEQNDPSFVRQLAHLADLYVNDAFGTAHRAHASTEGVAHLLPAFAGLLLARELEVMGEILEHPERPFWAIIGGAKISTKIGVIQNLAAKVDGLIVGGAMAFTFLRAQGFETGKSLVEPDQVDLAKGILADFQQRGIPLLLPE